MASSLFISSTLSLAEQAERLRAFVAARKGCLSMEASEHIVSALQLSRPSRAQGLARRLRDALLAHGIAVSYQAALEGLAKLCKATCWMRVRQGALPFETEAGGQRAFCMQIVRTGEADSPFKMEGS